MKNKNLTSSIGCMTSCRPVILTYTQYPGDTKCLAFVANIARSMMRFKFGLLFGHIELAIARRHIEPPD